MTAVVRSPTLVIWLPDSLDFKACTVLLFSLSPLHHLQSCEDAWVPCMVWWCLLTLPQKQRQRTYRHTTQVITSMTVWIFRPCLITEASFYTLLLLHPGVFPIPMPSHWPDWKIDLCIAIWFLCCGWQCIYDIGAYADTIFRNSATWSTEQ